MEDADGVGAAADAGDDRVGQAAFHLHDLLARLVADHRLEVAHHLRIGVRAGGRADQVVRVLDVGHPVAERLVHGVLERAVASGDRMHLGAEHPHAEHVRLLPLDVGGAHVDDAGQAEARRHCRRGDAVLTGAGLGDDARLAHAAGEEDLAEAVVDLVRAGVIQLLALQIDFGAAKMLGQPLGEIERRGAPGVVRVEAVELGVEGGIVLRRGICRFEFEDERHQRLGDEASAVQAEEAALVRAGAETVRLLCVSRRGAFLDAVAPSPRGALAMKARMRAGSFLPGAVSTPEETSTPGAPVTRSASATLAGVRPPPRR